MEHARGTEALTLPPDRVPGVEGVAPEIGSTVGEYTLEWRLGSGGFSEVWLGRHPVSGGLAAIKILRRGFGAHARTLFEREARAIARLHHPHIVSLFDLGPGYLVSAYIEGSSLARRLETPVDPAYAVRITLQIASALAHAHEQGVVHRDVKPGNILLDACGTAFLADFGLALVASEKADDIGGTPAYMAPERARTAVVGLVADQHALGRTLLEMLLGRPLPRERCEVSALGLPAGLPGPLVEAADRATRNDPADRWSSVADLAAALAEIDLGGFRPPVVLAPTLRPPEAFRWCAGPRGPVEAVSPDVARAHYRLSEVAASFELPRRPREALRAVAGVEDLGWTVYGRTDRIGPITSPEALARATQLVVMIPGMAYTREMWSPLAEAVCRDNAQTVVLTTEIMGFGECRYTGGGPAPDQATPRAVMQGILDWLETLGLGKLPKVLIGHSAATIPLLSYRDEELGDRASRLIIAPIIPFTNRDWQRRVKMFRPIAGLGRLTAWPFKTLMAAAFREASGDLPEALSARFQAEARAWSPSLFLGLLPMLATGTPVPADGLRRCKWVAGVEDPYVATSAVEEAVGAIGFNRNNLHWALSGGHYPHLPSRTSPEKSARNFDQIVRVLNALLIDAREGAPALTEMGTTQAP